MMQSFTNTGNKILWAVCLLLVFFSVFTACNPKNNSEASQDPASISAIDAAHKENPTDSTFAFEEEDLDLPAKENEKQTASASASESQAQTQNSQNTPTESTTKNDVQNNPSLPPKADSQKGEWGASVNN